MPSCLFSSGDCFSIVFEVWIQNIKDVLDGSAPTDSDKIYSVAQQAVVICRFCSACHTAARLLPSDRTLCYYMAFLFYARFSFAPQSQTMKIPLRFLDGFRNIPILSGDAGSITDDQLQKFNGFNVKDIVVDRFKTATKLCELDAVQLSQRCAKYAPNDLDGNVGCRIAAFVGRARLLAQHAAKRNTRLKCNCQATGCSHQILNMSITSSNGTHMHSAMAEVFGVNESSSSSSSDSSEDEAEEQEKRNTIHNQVGAYWRVVCPTVMATIPSRIFCSETCASSYETLLRNIVPISATDVEYFEAATTCGKTGLVRVAAASRAAFKRNISIQRSLRISRRQQKHDNPIPKALQERIHTNITDMLNIDNALLFAASYIASSPSACIGRTLPGTHTKWRDECKSYIKAIETIKSLYKQHNKEHHSLSADETHLPLWLQRVRDQAFALFPVQSMVEH